jgi:H+/Cl- antiporter ClcA
MTHRFDALLIDDLPHSLQLLGMANTHQEAERRLRIVFISCCAFLIAVSSVVIARLLLVMISFFDNLFYYGKISLADSHPDTSYWGWFSILIPAIGGLLVGVMARFGSPAIRGHGIPEAMESILTKHSRVPKRLAILKPLSSAIAIGSGGPFGAEGPIIATGGAIGSIFGQFLSVTNYERKILLACGAASGMAAIFGTPFSAVLLAIELLLFEFRAKSFAPVVLAATTATTFRYAFVDSHPFFAMPEIQPPDLTSFSCYILFGIFIGFFCVIVTKSIYWIEDAFEKLPIHWMWWPALGGLAVGLIGMIEPRTLGVGYNNITDALSGNITIELALILVIFKFLSWAIALGSGTSGGTLAPILTFGSCLGFVVGSMLHLYFPELHIDPHVMALIGMAALFAGTSKALLTSVLFAFEASRQSAGLVPLLVCSVMAYLVASLLMRDSIMTEKIVRRGIHVPHEYFPT